MPFCAFSSPQKLVAALSPFSVLGSVQLLVERFVLIIMIAPRAHHHDFILCIRAHLAPHDRVMMLCGKLSCSLFLFPRDHLAAEHSSSLSGRWTTTFDMFVRLMIDSRTFLSKALFTALFLLLAFLNYFFAGQPAFRSGWRSIKQHSLQFVVRFPSGAYELFTGTRIYFSLVL